MDDDRHYGGNDIACVARKRVVEVDVGKGDGGHLKLFEGFEWSSGANEIERHARGRRFSDDAHEACHDRARLHGEGTVGGKCNGGVFAGKQVFFEIFRNRDHSRRLFGFIECFAFGSIRFDGNDIDHSH